MVLIPNAYTFFLLLYKSNYVAFICFKIFTFVAPLTLRVHQKRYKMRYIKSTGVSMVVIVMLYVSPHSPLNVCLVSTSGSFIYYWFMVALRSCIYLGSMFCCTVYAIVYFKGKITSHKIRKQAVSFSSQELYLLLICCLDGIFTLVYIISGMWALTHTHIGPLISCRLPTPSQVS